MASRSALRVVSPALRRPLPAPFAAPLLRSVRYPPPSAAIVVAAARSQAQQRPRYFHHSSRRPSWWLPDWLKSSLVPPETPAPPGSAETTTPKQASADSATPGTSPPKTKKSPNKVEAKAPLPPPPAPPLTQPPAAARKTTKTKIPKPPPPPPPHPTNTVRPEAQRRPHYRLTFTCIPCSEESTHYVSKQGYHHGSVLITCPGCRNRHVISDHLGIFGDRKITVEDLMRERGRLVKKGALGEDGDVEWWPENEEHQQGQDWRVAAAVKDGAREEEEKGGVQI